MDDLIRKKMFDIESSLSIYEENYGLLPDEIEWLISTVKEQQKEIKCLNTKIKWFEMFNKEIVSDIPKHVKDYDKKSRTYKSDGKSDIKSWF